MDSVVAYIMFGLVCSVNPQLGPDWHCLNFWQDPAVYYKTLDECEIAAKKQAKSIQKSFEKENLIVVKLEISCMNTKTKKLEKSLQTRYHIL